MNYKMKHLSKYCCKPANETEFEAVKMAAELGGMKFDKYFSWHEIGKFPFVSIDEIGMYNHDDGEQEINVIDFIKKLRMTEEEAKELEDDRVEMSTSKYNKIWRWSSGDYAIEALNGHYFRVSEDGLTVTLHKGGKTH
jgi:hypothetical protein